MTIFNTIEDFLRVLRENDGVRSAVRRELLTEDVLGLPAQFSEMLKVQNSILEEQRSLRQDTNSLRETQNSILDTLAIVLRGQGDMSRDIGALHGMYRRQHDDLGRFRGNYAMDAARKNRSEISKMFARLRGMGRMRFRVLDSAELSDMLDESYESLDALNLGEEAWNTFDSSDLIVAVTERRGSRLGFYIAVEASFTGGDRDVSRAIAHAKILRCATGLDAYAVVAAVRLDPNVENLVLDDAAKLQDADNEDVALWYPIVEEDLESLDPY